MATFLQWYLVLIALGVVHIAIHEMGHILGALAVGSKIKQIGWSKLGPFIRRAPARTPQRDAIVALAGPGINILTWLVMSHFRIPHAWVALYFGCFNLLPIPHSDLRQALRYLGIKFALSGMFQRNGA